MSGDDTFEQHRSYLLRYAVLQLGDHDQAEDAVQETCLRLMPAERSLPEHPR